MKYFETPRIICAVRGVPKSRETATRAIDLALENKARLTFVHVTNIEFLGSATPIMTPIRSVQKQLHDLSEFAMMVLCDRASRRGVQEVDYIVRMGQIYQHLRQVLSEIQPDMLVIGRPIGRPADSDSLIPDELSSFIEDIEQNLKIQVIPVEIEIAD
jgi:nucleotide-binding universal stress UspA family protein